MGALSSCNCNKDHDIHDLDLKQEKNQCKDYDCPSGEDNTAITTTNYVNKINISGADFFDDPNCINSNDNSQIMRSKAANPNTMKSNINDDGDGINNNLTDSPTNLVSSGHGSGNGSGSNIFPFNLNGLISSTGNRNKRFSNLGNNPTTGSRLPLEVINELNADISLSKDSIGDGRSIRLLKGINSNNITTVISEADKKDKENINIELSQKKNLNCNENMHDLNSSSEVKQNNLLHSSNIKIVNEKESSSKRKTQHIINSIVPESKLFNPDYDEVLFQSSLKKVINKANSSIIYSERFCTITKMEFRCYKSKEQFLTLQKPIQVIPFFEIIDICLVNIKPNSRKLDHLQIRIYKKRANKQPRRSPILENTKQHSRLHSMELEKINNTVTNEIKAKRISLIDTSTIHNQSQHMPLQKKIGLDEDLNSSCSHSSILFTADKEDVLNKWAIVINYLITN